VRSLVAALLVLAVALSACGGAPTTPAAPADYCAAARANLEASAVLAGSSGTGFTPEAIARIRSTNDAVVAAAPAEIKDAVAASATVSTALLDALERNGGDVTKAISDPAFNAASQAAGSIDPKVVEYAQNVCGLDIGAATGG
jgi:ABC-type transport system substrate-binding protein